jgi:hypothetical protein
MKKIFISFIFLPLFLLVFASKVTAKLGVGVGTGKIQVDEELRAGMIYELPNLSVFNTGDEPSYYEVSIDFRSGQKQLKPKREWFVFSPKQFYLEPGDAKSVEVSLKLPLKGVEPGDYFCFLLGRPVVNDVSDTTGVGIAAAAKLYFTVKPANVLSATYYRLLHFWQDYYPWTAIVSGTIAGLIVLVILWKILGISINVRTEKKKEKGKEKQKTHE